MILPYAKSWYWIWTPTRRRTEEVTGEVKRIARGAARATGTRVKIDLFTGTYHRLPNAALGELIDQNLRLVGAPRFSRSDKAYARKLGLHEPLVETVEPARKDYIMPVTNRHRQRELDRPVRHVPDQHPRPRNPATSLAVDGPGRFGHRLEGNCTSRPRSWPARPWTLCPSPQRSAACEREFGERTRGFEYKSPI